MFRNWFSRRTWSTNLMLCKVCATNQMWLNKGTAGRLAKINQQARVGFVITKDTHCLHPCHHHTGLLSRPCHYRAGRCSSHCGSCHKHHQSCPGQRYADLCCAHIRSCPGERLSAVRERDEIQLLCWIRSKACLLLPPVSWRDCRIPLGTLPAGQDRLRNVLLFVSTVLVHKDRLPLNMGIEFSDQNNNYTVRVPTSVFRMPSPSASSSQASPIPSLSASSCPELGTVTQLSWSGKKHWGFNIQTFFLVYLQHTIWFHCGMKCQSSISWDTALKCPLSQGNIFIIFCRICLWCMQDSV